MNETIINIESNNKYNFKYTTECKSPKKIVDIIINEDVELLKEELKISKNNYIHSRDLLKICYINNNREIAMIIFSDVQFNEKNIYDYNFLLDNYNFEMLKLFIEKSSVSPRSLLDNVPEKIILNKYFELLYFLKSKIKKFKMKMKISYFEHFINKKDYESLQKLLDFVYEEISIKYGNIICGVNDKFYKSKCEACFYRFLCEACKNNNVTLAKILLKYPIFNPTGYSLGYTENYTSCKQIDGLCNYDIISHYKVYCYCCDRTDKYEVILDYPFKISCQYGHTELVKLLLKNKYIDPSIDDNYGLKKALENNHSDVIKLINNFQNSSEYKIRKILICSNNEIPLSYFNICFWFFIFAIPISIIICVLLSLIIIYLIYK